MSISKTLLRKLLVVAICAQLTVLLYMAAKREFIYAYGEEVYLRSAPIDPRDPFRGDFVRLRYGMNRIVEHRYQGETPIKAIKQGAIIFAVLQEQQDGVFYASHFSDIEPETGLYIKGRITTKKGYRSSNQHFVDAKFGIEQYFVQQGRGKDMEAKLGSRNTLQVPAEMQLALGSDGTAVLRGHRWSKLGVQVIFERTAAAPTGETNASEALSNEAFISPLMTIIFENVSEQPLGFASLAGDCSFSLIASDPGNHRENIDVGCDASQSQTETVTILQPGERHSFAIDLDTPRWYFPNEKGELVEMAQQNLWLSYRLRYTAPNVDNSWQGFMDTPAFRPTGNID
ncbi:Uncharacterized membrane-anchored protein [Alteromonadaceae bacterium Bs31]|nr:Uncharacterized membrane-anchored protein [Alteromonadaceae bacterium Bs31]